MQLHDLYKFCILHTNLAHFILQMIQNLEHVTNSHSYFAWYVLQTYPVKILANICLESTLFCYFELSYTCILRNSLSETNLLPLPSDSLQSHILAQH